LGVSIPSQNAGGYSVAAHGAGANGGNGSTDSTTFSVPALSTMEMPDGCRFCGGTLPQSRPVTYCPHCGQNLAAKHCEGCGAELDSVWKFCVNCGKKA
ncbi:MAG: zinc ribbon domain-containing protein, partial [Gemmatimonadota bacterium]|nr:zinc ribbon domain-containing protein [Gemmatimonadota bacterium]